PPSIEWEGATVTHFRVIKGVDLWKDYDRVVVIGRDQPAIEEVEAKARAIWATAPEPLRLLGTGKLPELPRGYRLRCGQLLAVNAQIHPDPRCQSVLELTRERTLMQAIDRLRLVHCTRAKPAEAIIVGNLPLPITADRLIPRSFTKIERVIL